MSDGQTEACEANAPVIDWSRPLEIWDDTMWVPAELLWQSDKWALVDFDGKPAIYWKPACAARFRNAPSPPQYRPFTEEELPDLVGRRFRRKLEPSEIGLATLSSRGAMSIGGWKFGAEAILDELELDDNGQWVPAGVRL